MSKTFQFCNRAVLQNDQDKGGGTASGASGSAGTKETQENIQLLISIFDGLNELSSKLSRLDSGLTRYAEKHNLNNKNQEEQE